MSGKVEWASFVDGALVELLGEPVERVGAEWRWPSPSGGRRALCVNVSKCIYADHSAGTGGHVSALFDEHLGGWRSRNDWLEERGWKDKPDFLRRGGAGPVSRARQARPPVVAPAPDPIGAAVQDDGRKAAFAASLWSAGQPAAGTLANAYLEARCAWPAGEPLPGTVRWLPWTRWPGRLPRWWPEGAAGAVLWGFAPMGSGEVAAVGVEVLDEKAARVVPRQRRVYGHQRGTAFNAAPGRNGRLVLVEGAVDALAVAAVLVDASVYAVGGRFSVPLEAGQGVVLLADGDAPGRRGAAAAAVRMRAQGVAVRVEGCAPDEDPGSVVAGWVGERIALGQDEAAAWQGIRDNPPWLQDDAA